MVWFMIRFICVEVQLGQHPENVCLCKCVGCVVKKTLLLKCVRKNQVCQAVTLMQGITLEDQYVQEVYQHIHICMYVCIYVCMYVCTAYIKYNKYMVCDCNWLPS